MGWKLVYLPKGLWSVTQSPVGPSQGLMLRPILLNIFINLNHLDDRTECTANLQVALNWGEWCICQRVVLPSKGTSTGWRNWWQEIHEMLNFLLKEEVQSPTSEVEQPQAPGYAEGQQTGRQLCRKVPRSPGGLQVKHKSAVWPCHKEG